MVRLYSRRRPEQCESGYPLPPYLRKAANGSARVLLRDASRLEAGVVKAVGKVEVVGAVGNK
eukprot:4218141-Prymnesium_polylepis.1